MYQKSPPHWQIWSCSLLNIYLSGVCVAAFYLHRHLQTKPGITRLFSSHRSDHVESNHIFKLGSEELYWSSEANLICFCCCEGDNFPKMTKNSLDTWYKNHKREIKVEMLVCSSEKLNQWRWTSFANLEIYRFNQTEEMWGNFPRFFIST